MRKFLIYLILGVFLCFTGVYFVLKQGWLSDQKSISFLRTQYQFFPRNPQIIEKLATALRQDESYQDSEKKYLTIQKIKEEGLEVNNDASTLKILNQVAEIETLYKKAVQIKPDFALAHYHFAEFYFDTHQWQKALDYYKEAINLDPNNQGAYKRLAFIYGDVFGDVSKAIVTHERMLDQFRQDESVYTDVILSYKDILERTPDNVLVQKASRDVFDRYNALINQQKPPKAKGFFQLGVLYEKAGYFDRAISAYLYALDLDKSHIPSMLHLGKIYQQRSKFQDANEYYNRVLTIDSKNSQAYYDLGTVYMYLGNVVEAKNYFLKAVENDAENGEAYFYLGYIEEIKNQLEKAKELYLKAVKFDSHNPEVYYNLGNVYSKLEMLNEAKNAFLKAVRYDKNHMNAWVNLSIVSLKLGSYQDAIKYCDEAILLGYKPPAAYLRSLSQYR